MEYSRDAQVTNFGSQQHQYTRNLSKFLTLSLLLGLSQLASARGSYSGQSYSNDYIYVQAPAMNSNQAFTYTPVIPPGQIPDGQMDQVGHLWPRSVSYSMQTNSLEAYLQSDLKIGMKYNYSFNFDLAARNGQGRGMATPDGWYQLQIAVIKKSGVGLRGQNKKADPLERYVTSASMFLKVTNGSFARRISLRFPDIRETSRKHHLFIELIPLQEDCDENGQKIRCIKVDARGEADPDHSILEPRPGYKTYLLEMPFMPFMPAGGKVGDVDDLSDEEQAFLGGSLAKYIARAQLLKNRQAIQGRDQNSPAEHARKNNLSLMSLDDPKLSQSAALIRKILDNKSLGTIKFDDNQKAMLVSLCTQLVANQDEFQARNAKMPFQRERSAVVKTHIRWCTKDPATYMRMSRVLHVGQTIPSKIERLAQKPLTYTLMSNFMSNRSISRDAYSSVNIKPPDILIKMLDMVGIGFNHSVTVGNSRSRSEMGVASMADSLDFNYVIFNIPTTGSQQCLEVRGQNEPGTFFYVESPKGNMGLYICDRKDDAIIETPELYAHVFERCKDTTMMECDKLSQSVNVALRGEREVSAFFYAIRGGISPDHNNRVTPFGDMDKAESYFAGIPLMDTMEIITPVEFPQEKIPSFLELATGRNRLVID